VVEPACYICLWHRSMTATLTDIHIAAHQDAGGRIAISKISIQSRVSPRLSAYNNITSSGLAYSCVMNFDPDREYVNTFRCASNHIKVGYTSHWQDDFVRWLLLLGTGKFVNVLFQKWRP
jgi:hypothetical protein